jgi:hypothetical protein
MLMALKCLAAAAAVCEHAEGEPIGQLAKVHVVHAGWLLSQNANAAALVSKYIVLGLRGL